MLFRSRHRSRVFTRSSPSPKTRPPTRCRGCRAKRCHSAPNSTTGPSGRRSIQDEAPRRTRPHNSMAATCTTPERRDTWEQPSSTAAAHRAHWGPNLVLTAPRPPATTPPGRCQHLPHRPPSRRRRAMPSPPQSQRHCERRAAHVAARIRPETTFL